MKTASIMIKPASGLCNLKCSYCFYADEMSNREIGSYGMMTKETMKALIEKSLFAFDAVTYIFQGGEPTLMGIHFYEDFVETVEKQKKPMQKISYGIQTNGQLLDEKWCRFLAKNRFLVGVSLDGIQATHDCYRVKDSGEGTYIQTLNAIEGLKKAGADVNVLTVVNRKTAVRIEKIYKQYAKKGLLWQQYILCLDPMMDVRGNSQYSIDPASYGQFLIQLFALWKADLQAGKQPYIRQFENYIGILLGYEPESCEQRGQCGEMYVVEADGGVYPCDFYVLDAYRLGSVLQNSFAEIDENRKATSFIEQSENKHEKCSSCPYRKLCRGGCRRHREYGVNEANLNYFCEGYRIFFDRCYEDLLEIANKIRG